MALAPRSLQDLHLDEGDQFMDVETGRSRPVLHGTTFEVTNCDLKDLLEVRR